MMSSTIRLTIAMINLDQTGLTTTNLTNLTTTNATNLITTNTANLQTNLTTTFGRAGTYQCSVLRRCHPPPKTDDASEEQLVAITKSLYVKVDNIFTHGMIEDWWLRAGSGFFKPGV